MPVIALGRLRWGADLEPEDSLGYIVSPNQKERTNIK